MEVVTDSVKYHFPTLKFRIRFSFSLGTIAANYSKYFSFSEFEHGHFGDVVVDELSVNGSAGRFQAERSQVTPLRVINAENEIATDCRVDRKTFIDRSNHVLILPLEQLKISKFRSIESAISQSCHQI